MTIAFGHVSQKQTADEWWTYFLALEKLAESSVAIGPAFDCLRLGIILSQSFAYQMSYARGDAWPTRYLVYYLFLGSLAHSTYSLYIAIINDLQVTWTECTSIQENGRAVRSCLSQSSALPSRLANLGLGIAVQAMDPSNFLYATISPVFLAWDTSWVVLDWTISGLIIAGILKQRSGFLQSDKMITRLVVLSIEAQIIPSLGALGFLIKTLVAPLSPAAFMFACAPKVWVITCLLVISSRHSIRREVEGERQRRAATFDLGLTQGTADTGPAENFMSFITASASGPASTGKGTVNEYRLPGLPELEVAY